MNQENKLLTEIFLKSIKKDQNDCWLWFSLRTGKQPQKANRDGRQRVRFPNHKYKSVSIDRLSLSLFKGVTINDKMESIHNTCSTDTCVNPDHLIVRARHAHLPICNICFKALNDENTIPSKNISSGRWPHCKECHYFYMKKAKKRELKYCKCGKFLRNNDARSGYCSIECSFNDSFDVVENGCWIWNKSFSSSGYPTITYKNKGSASYTAKRVAMHIKNKRFPLLARSGDRALSANTCKNRNCVNVDHITFSNSITNIGTSNYKLLDSQVHEIINLYEIKNWNASDISRFYKVSYNTIVSIVQNKTYKHIERKQLTLKKDDSIDSDEAMQAMLDEINKSLGE